MVRFHCLPFFCWLANWQVSVLAYWVVGGLGVGELRIGLLECCCMEKDLGIRSF